MKKWAKKKIDFGQRHRHETFEYVRLNDPSYCTWVLRNVMSRSKTVYSETLIDFGDYLKIHKKLEADALKCVESGSEKDGEASESEASIGMDAEPL